MDHMDDKLKKVMQMSKMEMPFEDFEQRMMKRIEGLESARVKALADKKYAIVFFLLGSICGIFLNNYMMRRIQVFDIAVVYRNYLVIGSQLLCALLICFFCLQLWRLIKIQQHSNAH